MNNEIKIKMENYSVRKIIAKINNKQLI